MLSMEAILFDFDGLLVDTESQEYAAWRRLFADHGCDLPLAVWVQCVGTTDSGFDPCVELERQAGRQLNHEQLRSEARRALHAAMESQPMMPGAREWLAEAKQTGLKTALVSSSDRNWIERFAGPHGILSAFDVIRCRDDVTRTKPHPELYLDALKALNVPPGRAIAVEDSPNGLLAAKAAGLRCIVVPNAITHGLSFNSPDLVLDSLGDMSLSSALRHLQGDRSVTIR